MSIEDRIAAMEGRIRRERIIMTVALVGSFSAAVALAARSPAAAPPEADSPREKIETRELRIVDEEGLPLAILSGTGLLIRKDETTSAWIGLNGPDPAVVLDGPARSWIALSASEREIPGLMVDYGDSSANFFASFITLKQDGKLTWRAPRDIQE